jgi:hypothetical protein
MAERNAQRALFGYMTTDLNLLVTTRVLDFVVWPHLSPYEAVLTLLVCSLCREDKSVGMCGRDPKLLRTLFLLASLELVTFL